MSSFQMTARFQPPDGETNLKLSKIIGVTSLTNSCFAEDDHGLVTYAAGCIAILYQPNTNKQLKYFKVTRAISSLAMTRDGVYLAIGERGHQPTITIWNTSTSEKLSTLIGHQHGVRVLKFSLDGEYLVSAGFKTDKQLIVWDWKESKQTCSTKLENKVNSIDFHLGGQFFVTCGENHLKWWYMIKETNPQNNKQIVKGLNGRPASILDAQRNSNFVDILCAKISMDQSIYTNVYTLSSTGMLCLIHETRLMDKWVQVDSTQAYCLALTHSSYVLVGCTNGRILAFSAISLEYLTSLPLPNPIAGVQTTIKYPACYCICPLSTPHIVSTYADRSMFIWDITDIHQPIKLRSLASHSSCIWDLQFLQPQSTTSTSPSSSNDSNGLPTGTFFTCGADNTINVWNTDPQQQRLSSWKTTLSRDLLHSMCLDISDETIHLKGTLPKDDTNSELDLSCPTPDFELPDRQQGIHTARCLALHPNGTELACGTKRGVVHIYNLQTMKPLSEIPSGIKAHDAEILTLSYSPSIHDDHQSDQNSSNNETYFLASGGRDRLIHIYDATPTLPENQRYHLVTTLDSHSSSITITHFTSDGQKFISCSGDKTMVLNNIHGHEFHRLKSIPTPHGTINGFALDSATSKFAVSTGQDKRINVWNIQSGKLVRSYKPEGLNSEFYKCCVDPSGMFVATCSFDKHIRIYDFFSGELIHQDYGHSELITAVKFSPDGKNLISVGGDGCIMIWEIGDHLVEAMQDRLVELFAIAERKKQVVEAKIQSSLPSAAHSGSTPKHNIRTGGLVSKPAAVLDGSNSEGIVGKSMGSSKRPVTSSVVNTSEKSTPNRPVTAGEQSKQNLPPPPASARRLPAWAAKGEKSFNPNAAAPPPPIPEPYQGSPSDRLPQNKWANRVNNQNLQILGKPLVNKDKHKLTLELTASENTNTWSSLAPALAPAPTSAPLPIPPTQQMQQTQHQNTDRLASTLEELDDVLIMDHHQTTNDVASLDTSDDEEDGDELIEGNDDTDEDRLNQTMSNLDQLEESAEKLESWLEKKLREETQVDDSVAIEDISIEENKNDSSSSQSLLGSSLSSDFFKKIRENPDSMNLLPPPPEYSPKNKISSNSSMNSKEGLYQKQQETAAAVSDMRNRLQAMGILEKTAVGAAVSVNENIESRKTDSTQNSPEFLPPPPPPQQQQQLPTSLPDTSLTIQNDDVDDTASTVSGGSDLMNEKDQNDTVTSSALAGPVADNDEDEEDGDENFDESSYRELLSELAIASQRALGAYKKLLTRKKQSLETEKYLSLQINSSLTAPPVESVELRPSYSAASPRINRNNTKTSNLDQLLQDFEANFGNIVNSAENILATSGVHHSLTPSHQSSLIGARQSNIEFNPSRSNIDASATSMDSRMHSMIDDRHLFDSLRHSVGSEVGTTSEPSAGDVSMILEKYSDRLVMMVADKMLAKQNNSKL